MKYEKFNFFRILFLILALTLISLSFISMSGCKQKIENKADNESDVKPPNTSKSSNLSKDIGEIFEDSVDIRPPYLE